ncbi:hypothetical protein EVAR_84502_1 [Eumeta japonica]|uniref:Uncharacterized protein n=1 Tax=Eumeta variegata TaxID=151549 RepID=A0A4C1UJ82_EUMVA|nr:hypothetical protein EVAR_84502_1 [Eumeta japonica]
MQRRVAELSRGLPRGKLGLHYHTTLTTSSIVKTFKKISTHHYTSTPSNTTFSSISSLLTNSINYLIPNQEVGKVLMTPLGLNFENSGHRTGTSTRAAGVSQVDFVVDSQLFSYVARANMPIMHYFSTKMALSLFVTGRPEGDSSLDNNITELKTLEPVLCYSK